MDHIETESYLDALENVAGRKFRHRSDIKVLLELSSSRANVFEEIVFYAKFISNAYAVLRRTGSAGEDTSRLSAEFEEKLGRSASLIRTMLADATPEVRTNFTDRFLAPSPDSMARFLDFLNELSWIKNYHNDKKRAR
ncbi:MAG: hypothetical protein AUI33_05380 [Ignavibacteria bacterium 13_1_40CM_2_61_4]|nr:MAG: hypothetical protein AUI33_05380 [Ignavibacteria bacterium 13_1_40CM_2_61_4]